MWTIVQNLVHGVKFILNHLFKRPPPWKRDIQQRVELFISGNCMVDLAFIDPLVTVRTNDDRVNHNSLGSKLGKLEIWQIGNDFKEELIVMRNLLLFITHFCGRFKES